jgi:CheY-like chemotaxis protein
MKKVLLVDDIGISNFIVKKLIGNLLPGCQVEEYTDPSMAFAALPQLDPDIIFLDLNMHLMNGWHFLHLMQENRYRNEVVILTSSTSQEDRERSGQYPNVKKFIVKPLTPEDLLGLFTK